MNDETETKSDRTRALAALDEVHVACTTEFEQLREDVIGYAFDFDEKLRVACERKLKALERTRENFSDSACLWASGLLAFVVGFTCFAMGVLISQTSGQHPVLFMGSAVAMMAGMAMMYRGKKRRDELPPKNEQRDATEGIKRGCFEERITKDPLFEERMVRAYLTHLIADVETAHIGEDSDLAIRLKELRDMKSKLTKVIVEADVHEKNCSGESAVMYRNVRAQLEVELKEAERDLAELEEMHENVSKGLTACKALVDERMDPIEFMLTHAPLLTDSEDVRRRARLACTDALDAVNARLELIRLHLRRIGGSGMKTALLPGSDERTDFRIRLALGTGTDRSDGADPVPEDSDLAVKGATAS